MKPQHQKLTDEVCLYLGYTQRELSIENRQQEVAMARHLAISYLLQNKVPRRDAAEAFERDRASTYHSQKVINNVLQIAKPQWAFDMIQEFLTKFLNHKINPNETDKNV